MGVCDVPIVVDSLAKDQLEQSSDNDDNWYHLEFRTRPMLGGMTIQTNEGERQPTLYLGSDRGLTCRQWYGSPSIFRDVGKMPDPAPYTRKSSG